MTGAPLAVPPTRQHPGWIAISAIRQFRGLIIPVIILAWSRGSQGDGGALLVFALLTAATLLWQVVAWWNLTYEVTDGRLIVRSGAFSRRERFVPLERVQAVDLSDTPLQRVFGLATVRIETAAAGVKEADVRLEAVPRLEAEALRAGMLAARGAPAPAEEKAPALFSLSALDVLKAGATSGRIAPALAALVFVAQLAREVLPEETWVRMVERLPAFGLRGAAGLAIAAALAAWLVAIAGAALTWTGFELRREGDRLLISHGLLDRRRTSVPISRIQAVTIREGMLRRPFGLADVTFTSAGWGTEGRDAGTLAPIIPKAAAPALIAAAAPAFAPPEPLPDLAGPPPRATMGYLLSALVPACGLVAAAVLVAAWLPRVAWWWGLLALAAVPVAALDGWFGRRDSGAAATAGSALVRQGGLTRALTVTVPARVQWRRITRNPFMRRSGLATLSLGIARGRGSGVTEVRLLARQDAERLVAELSESSQSPARDGYTFRRQGALEEARDARSKRTHVDERGDAGAGAGGALRGPGTGSASPAARIEDDPGRLHQGRERGPDGGVALPDGPVQG